MPDKFVSGASAGLAGADFDVVAALLDAADLAAAVALAADLEVVGGTADDLVTPNVVMSVAVATRVNDFFVVTLNM